MKKLMVPVFFTLLLSITITVGPSANAVDNIKSYKELGIKISMKGFWGKYYKNLSVDIISGYDKKSVTGLMVNFIPDEMLSNSSANKKMGIGQRTMFIVAIAKTSEISKIEVEKNVRSLNNGVKVEKIAEHNGRTYYFCSGYDDYKNICQECKKKYIALENDLKNMKKNIWVLK